LKNLKQELVLNVQFGGLGDNLFLSPVPRLYKEKYPNGKFYISNNSKFRSSQIKEIIWEMNPYIDGFISDNGLIPKYGNGKAKMNILTQLAYSLEIDIDYNLEPEIYYKPTVITSFINKTFVDLNYTSFVGSFSKKKIINLLKDEKNIVLVNPPDWALNIGDSINSGTLKNYIDLIHSSKKFICFTSGGATLAAAINKPSICLYGYGQNSIFHHSYLHDYIDVKKGYLILDFLSSFYLKLKNKLRIYFC
jgi:ADP-heptose:LPS heptosyltransferase